VSHHSLKTVWSRSHRRQFASWVGIVLLAIAVPVAIWQRDSSEETIPETEARSSADYTQLENQLRSRQWREADGETARLMREVGDLDNSGGVLSPEIDRFSCADLQQLDLLWVEYSDGRFGFSVQKDIYRSLGGTREYSAEIWEAFEARVGWREGGEWLLYDDLTFDLSAPVGHLPVVRVEGDLVWSGFEVVEFFDRAETCQL